MALIEQQGTTWGFSVLPPSIFSRGFWAKTEFTLKNEFVSYHNVSEDIPYEEVEEWIFLMFRLLAGGYGKEKNWAFEKAGVSIDLCPYTENGEEVTREERRKKDCVMVIHMLMRSKKNFLGGVYSFVLHREELEKFANALRGEFYAAFSRFEKKRGDYLFVGVSPQGYTGCNYWYLDLSKKVKSGDYVWVCMGRHKTRQIVYVDNVRFCDEEDAPCDMTYVKSVERIATAKELEEWRKGIE